MAVKFHSLRECSATTAVDGTVEHVRLLLSLLPRCLRRRPVRQDQPYDMVEAYVTRRPIEIPTFVCGPVPAWNRRVVAVEDRADDDRRVGGLCDGG
jgi:hypothetical protein